MKQDSVHPNHMRVAASTLEEILLARKPADVILQQQFRQRRNAGARDRRTIAALVYEVLRNHFVLRAALGDGAGALALCAAQALRNGIAVPAMGDVDPAALARRLADFDESTLSAAQRHNLPDWLWQRFLRDFGAHEAPALAQALNQPATVDLRVNTLRADRAGAQRRLANEGIAATPTARSPFGLRLSQRVALRGSEAFRDGWIEPQDEGSQLLALHLNPQPGETVVDFCAGAGGKTLALGALMNNEGVLHAFDVSAARLSRLEPRLRRSGLRIVQRRVLRDEHDLCLAPLAARCDAVLIDAPCSATGTLRRNPELRLREPNLARLQALQQSILAAAAALVKPGGRLVYATCSLLREENEDVVSRFLDAHAGFAQAAGLRLLPHRDGTDGFYAATLRRI